MQLTIHLSNGQQYPFNITDGEPTEEFLATVKYWEVFDRPILRISDRKKTWTFNPISIEKIDFQTEVDPKWRSPENIISSKCITLDSYRRTFAALKPDKQAPDDRKGGQLIKILLEITMTSGTLVYFESLVLMAERRQQMVNLYGLFQRIGYAIPCETGGYIILNPKHIVCVHMHPGFPEDRDSAWMVDGLAGSV